MKNNRAVNIVFGTVGFVGIVVTYTSTNETSVGRWLVHFCTGALITCFAGIMHRILSK